MDASRLTSPERCAAVCAEAEPVLRNLQITLSYHDFAVAYAAQVGGANATWCAFACWASKSAGRFIRLQAAARRWGLGALMAGPLGEVSRQIAEGNRKVYAELAPLFAAFLEEFEGARAYDDGRVAAFTGALRAGPTEAAGQERLVHAFAALHRAQVEPDPARRAEWVFLANGLIGLHEQIRLQAHIEGGLAGAVSRMRGYARLLAGRLGVPRPLRRAGRAALLRAEARWKRMATEWVMHLPLADEHLDLSEDVPALAADGAYPEALRALLLPASRALLAEWDPTPDALAGSGTEDWCDLPDRMHFILELFRTRQQSPRVLAAPFGEAQQALIRAGRIPPGPL
jgi:hypothetical protein